MNSKKDPMGRAIADYWKNKKADRLRVFSPMFEEDEIPLKCYYVCKILASYTLLTCQCFAKLRFLLS